jgi:hypothetical protein
MEDKIRACQWGAFDVENYGDRLFPLIANEQLTARLPNLELVCHAPSGRTTPPDPVELPSRRAAQKAGS